MFKIRFGQSKLFIESPKNSIFWGGFESNLLDVAKNVLLTALWQTVSQPPNCLRPCLFDAFWIVFRSFWVVFNLFLLFFQRRHCHCGNHFRSCCYDHSCFFWGNTAAIKKDFFITIWVVKWLNGSGWLLLLLPLRISLWPLASHYTKTQR